MSRSAPHHIAFATSLVTGLTLLAVGCSSGGSQALDPVAIHALLEYDDGRDTAVEHGRVWIKIDWEAEGQSRRPELFGRDPWEFVDAGGNSWFALGPADGLPYVGFDLYATEFYVLGQARCLRGCTFEMRVSRTEAQLNDEFPGLWEANPEEWADVSVDFTANEGWVRFEGDDVVVFPLVVLTRDGDEVEGAVSEVALPRYRAPESEERGPRVTEPRQTRE